MTSESTAYATYAITCVFVPRDLSLFLSVVSGQVSQLRSPKNKRAKQRMFKSGKAKKTGWPFEPGAILSSEASQAPMLARYLRWLACDTP